MAFCPNCGAQVEGKFCARCGTSVAAPGSGASAAPPPPPPGAQSYGAPQQPPYTAQAPYTPPPAAAVGMGDNVAAALSYVLGLITGIIFLVLAPYNQSKFVRFHAFQAIFFHVFWIGLWILETILTVMMPFGLHMLTTLLAMVLSLGGLVIWIILILKAYQGERFKLPIIGDLAEKQA